MDPKIKEDLDAILQRRNDAERAAVQSAEVQKQIDAENLDAFYKARGEVVAPAMREFGDYLKGHGLAYRLKTEDKHVTAKGGVAPASIDFLFGPADRFNSVNDHDLAGMSLAFDERKRSVSIRESRMWPDRGGSSGPGGQASLDELTSAYVQDRLAALVKQVVNEPFAR